MLISILLGAPLWVWPLFAALVWLGLRASKTRETSAIGFYLLPLMAVISFNTLFKMPNQQLIWSAYGAAYVTGAFAGYMLQRRWLLGKNGMQLELAGEWFTMAVMMTIFWMNFVNGTVTAIAPELQANAVFLGVFALIVGISSGTFTGRAIKIIMS